jgi:hypothetical protein
MILPGYVALVAEYAIEGIALHGDEERDYAVFWVQGSGLKVPVTELVPGLGFKVP